jgi:hypothetical protein
MRFPLQPTGTLAIVPPPLLPKKDVPQALPASGRAALALFALGLMSVFAVAIWLRPYGPDGRPLHMETHTQLGLPPCTFYRLTGLPCPSCGMTTSFALLVRGDLWNSLCANAVGTLLAALCLALIPWSIASAVRGRLLWIVSLERTLTWLVLGFVVFMLVRWVIVLGLIWAAHGRDSRAATNERHGSRRSDNVTSLARSAGLDGYVGLDSGLRRGVDRVLSERG